jgi:hypothetical protein
MLFEANSELNQNRFPAFPLHFPAISGPNRKFSLRREWYHHTTDTIHHTFRQAAARAPWVNRVELMDVLMQAFFLAAIQFPQKKCWVVQLEKSHSRSSTVFWLVWNMFYCSIVGNNNPN